MRVLMISDVYFPRVNGVSTSIQTFARELVAKGHAVTLIAPDYGRPAAAEPFEIIRIPSRYLPLDPEDRILRITPLRRRHRALTERGYDLVHIQTPFVAHYAGLGLARRLGVPAVASYHTFFEQYFDKYVTFLPSAWLRFVARHFSAAQCNDVDGLVVPSRAMLEVLRGYGVATPAQVIPTGIQLGQFRRGDGAAFRARHDIAPEQPVLVHVGRIAHEKNIEFLLRMLVEVKTRVPDVLLVIAGEGPARRALQTLAAQLGVAEHVRFVGYLDRGGPLEDCYSAGDVFVFASRTETQGLVVLEALALGIPVVSTAVMGTREVLADGRGSLIAEEDETDFANKVVRLLRNPGLREELGRTARHYAEEWSAPVLADRMLAFYRKVLERRHDAQLLPITADDPKV
ncbi:glycosyltransferase [Thioflavicoccus mobilis 8321]|uniref:Glycosyltransferase n=1 Tax=Thioflavicoccus mobilis 8321 TaxID=765912 RepID=L0GZG6_9GAMM|nr:glycosyltransferase [Thioflavicoccus mobilis]AGA90704.1 glycosyltransferase [Thioflavicoccus mobilis 8321]